MQGFSRCGTLARQGRRLVNKQHGRTGTAGVSLYNYKTYRVDTSLILYSYCTQFHPESMQLVRNIPEEYLHRENSHVTRVQLPDPKVSMRWVAKSLRVIMADFFQT